LLNIDDRNKVRTVTLNRPQAMNAFNEALYHAASDALHNAADDGDVGVVMLTGTGRAFCADTDLREMQDSDPSIPFTEGARGFARLMRTFIDFPKPLVYAVNGIGVGLGTRLSDFVAHSLAL